MLHQERIKPPLYVYPMDDWKLIEKRFYPDLLPQMETMFSLSNGYLGMRGTFEEGAPVYQSGTFINGFHETWPIFYGEEAYGFAKHGQTIVKVTDGSIIRLYVDDEPFYLPAAQLLHFERVLDMQAGVLSREVLWETPSGKRVSIKSQRLVSFQYRHLAAISYEVIVQNARAPVVISSEVMVPQVEQHMDGDPRLAHGLKGRVLHPRVNYFRDQRLMLSHATDKSGMALACGVDHTLATECSYIAKTQSSEDSAKVLYNLNAEPDMPIKLVKYITYHKSKTQPPEELCERAEWTLDRAVDHGFENLLEGQREFLGEFWERSDIQVMLDPETAVRTTREIQQWIRFNLFHLCQASARVENTGIPAKGLTGSAYEGHYFWDTEIYVLPFLVYTAPQIAKNLLSFRYSLLDQARQRARDVNQKGALFPWRTINGEEASAYYAAGTAQYHINADIMYALKKYVDVTGDQAFLFREGAEMLVETARLWYDLGFFSDHKEGKFCIHGVTGPDEYNTVVNNNTFTNLMARENLWFAAQTVETLKTQDPERFLELVDETGLNPTEVQDWKRAAELMYIPFDEKKGIHPQDDSFLDREMWDFENTPKEKYPLLLSYHPLVIYRYQIIKQADVVMAMFLLGHEFTAEQKKRNFDYYDPLTTGDSSLSVGIQSILAFEVGYDQKALEYARYAVLMDLSDVGGNVSEGLHIASMGASWMVMVYGVAGLRDSDSVLSFWPRLTRGLERLRFPLQVQGQVLEVDITPESITYSLRRGEGMLIRHYNEDIRLSAENPAAVRPFKT